MQHEVAGDYPCFERSPHCGHIRGTERDGIGGLRTCGAGSEIEAAEKGRVSLPVLRQAVSGTGICTKAHLFKTSAHLQRIVDLTRANSEGEINGALP